MYIWKPVVCQPQSAEEAESTCKLLKLLDDLDFSTQPEHAQPASSASNDQAEPAPPVSDAVQVAATAAAAAAATALQDLEAAEAKTDSQRLIEMLDPFDVGICGGGGSSSSMAQFAAPRLPPRARSRSPPKPLLGRGVNWSHMRVNAAVNLENMTQLVHRLLRSAPTCPYTLGITTDPEYRFGNGRFGYKTMNATSLILSWARPHVNRLVLWSVSL